MFVPENIREKVKIFTTIQSSLLKRIKRYDHHLPVGIFLLILIDKVHIGSREFIS